MLSFRTTIIMSALFLILLTSSKAESSYFIGKNAFIENKGQWQSNVKYATSINGLNVAVTDKGIVYDYNRSEKREGYVHRKGHIVLMDFGTSNFSVSPVELSSGALNYFIGNNSEKWITDAKTYKSIKLNSVYAGIDVMLMFKDGNPRYDFLLNPGADPASIRLNFKGADYSKVTKDGNIAVGTQLGDMLHGSVFAYQSVNNVIKPVACKFKNYGGKIGFELGKYNKQLPLVIDPIVYATYWGGTGDDEITGFEMLANNSFIIFGNTQSVDLRTTEGAYEINYHDNKDAYVSKFTVSGSDFVLDFSTFVGTLDLDYAIGMGLDENGNIFLVGNTESLDFPIQNAFQRDFGGVIDGFIVKLSPDGSSLIYSTYLGGAKEDLINGMYVNSKGYIFVTGETQSNNFPIDAGAYQNKKKALNDAFVTQLNVSGTMLEFSTFLGGNGEDKAYAISVDENDNTFITGTTNSADYPILPFERNMYGEVVQMPYQRIYGGGYDGFVAKIREGAVEFSTFFGGAGNDYGKAILTEGDGTCYIAGETSAGANFPITSNAYQPTLKGGVDCFFAKLDKIVSTVRPGYATRKSQALIFSTYFGGNGNEVLKKMFRHPNNSSMLMLGSTKSSNYPIVNDESQYMSGTDGYITEFSLTGSAIVTSRLFAGGGDETVTGLGFDNLGNAIVAGTTSSQNLTLSANAIQNKFGGGTSDGYIYKTVNVGLFMASPLGKESYCVGNQVDIKWITENISDTDPIKIEISRISMPDNWLTITEAGKEKQFKWTIPNDFTPGNDFILRISHNSGISSVTTEGFSILPKPSLTGIQVDPVKTGYCAGDDLHFTSEATGNDLKYQWYFKGELLADADEPNLTIEDITKDHEGKYKLVVTDVCPPALTSVEINIVVLPTTEITLQPKDTSVKMDKPFELTIDAKGSNISYEWYKDGSKLIGETGKSVKIQSAVITDEGDYTCLVTGDCGSVMSGIAKVKVDTSTVSVRFGTEVYSEGMRLSAISDDKSDLLRIKLMSEFECNLSLKIFDNLGNELAGIFDGFIKQGANDFTVSTSNYQSGVYWLVATCGDSRTAQKFIVIK